MHRLGGNLLLAAGVVLGIAGLTFVAFYVQGAIVDRLGDPDQSLLFWYLPVLFIGIALAAAGFSLLRAALRRKRAPED